MASLRAGRCVANPATQPKERFYPTMCMLSYFPPGIVPNESHLENGADSNPDGHGFAIITGRAGSQRISTFKGMNADEVISRFAKVRHEHPEGPALFHSRIATSGLVDVTGCHPFRVGSDNRTVLGHNGILFQPSDESFKSDTRIFAELMLPRFGSLDSPRKFAKLEKFCSGNKLLVLTVNPARRKNAYLINGHLGNWTEGAWHSNYGWEDWMKYVTDYKSNTTTAYGPYATSKAGTEPWGCVACGARDSVSTYTLICDMCFTCNDCELHRNDCMCYYSGRSHRDDWEGEAANAEAANIASLVTSRTKAPWRAGDGIVNGVYVPPQQPGIVNGVAVPSKPLAITSGGWSHNS